MARLQRRRRVPAAGIFALLAPASAVLLTSYAFVAPPVWALAAAIVGAVAAAALGALVFQLQGRLRAEVATVRARQAAAYDAIHARYSAEHREFTAHMVSLLDEADERLTVLRRRLDDVQARLGFASSAAAPGPSLGTAGGSGIDRWEHQWPDLSELPTVVDLLSWDERSRNGLLPEAVNGEPAGGAQTA